MIATPPPPIVQCIDASSAEAANATSVITLSGDRAQLEAFLSIIAENKVWRVAADAESNGVRFVRLIGPVNLPFKEIGGLIFEAQRRQLTASYTNIPSICGLEGE